MLLVTVNGAELPEIVLETVESDPPILTGIHRGPEQDDVED